MSVQLAGELASGIGQTGFGSYMGRGMATMVGFEPTNVMNPTAGAEYWRWGTGNAVAEFGSRSRFHGPTSAGHPGLASIEQFSSGWFGAWANTLANPGMLAFDVASGFANGGIWGAKDALVWNVATNAAMASHMYSFADKGAGILQATSKGFFASGIRNVGASVGATVGQSIGGTPGAFLGAYIGAQPFAAMELPATLLGKIPKVGGVLATGYGVGMGVGLAGAFGVGVAAASTLGPIYGAYKATQFGAQYTAAKRNINTAGDLGAFMTNNANTMRARAVQAIHRSHINNRSALGMEAGFMHTRKSYGSPYRQGWI